MGDRGVGKTALVYRFCTDRFLESYDTIEDSSMKDIVVYGSICSLDITDATGFNEDFPDLRDLSIRDASAFVVVYSVTSRSSFEKVRENVSLIHHLKESTAVPLVIVGNKCDMCDKREVSCEEGKQAADMYHGVYRESSAKTRENVESVFVDAVHAYRVAYLSRPRLKGKNNKCVLS